MAIRRKARIQQILALVFAFVWVYLMMRIKPVYRQCEITDRRDHRMVNTNISIQSIGHLNSSKTKADTKERLKSVQVQLNNTLMPKKLNYLDVDKSMPDINELYNQLVIVTALSDDHAVEARGIIATAQQLMPGKKIIVYDIGMNDTTKKLIKSYCSVEYREFPFKSYPAHVSQVLVYAWKPIIINITLNEFGAIYWGDAGNRFLKSLKELLPYVQRNHGYITLFHSFDPKAKSLVKHRFYCTHPGMFDVFGINRDQYYKESNSSPHAAANRQLLINSTTVQTKIVGPLVQCALDFACISPGNASFGFHGYDASALSLIIYKNMKHEWTPENNINDVMNTVVNNSRDEGTKYQPMKCN